MTRRLYEEWMKEEREGLREKEEVEYGDQKDEDGIL